MLRLSRLDEVTVGRVQVDANGRARGTADLEGPGTAFLVLDEMRIVPLYLRPGRTVEVDIAGEDGAGVTFSETGTANRLLRHFAAALGVQQFPLKAPSAEFVEFATATERDATTRIDEAFAQGALDAVDREFLTACVHSHVEYAHEIHRRFRGDDDSAAALRAYGAELLPVTSAYLRADGGWRAPLESAFEGSPESDLAKWFDHVRGNAADTAAREYMLGRCALRALRDGAPSEPVLAALRAVAAEPTVALVRAHAKRMEHLRPGGTAPPIVAATLDGTPFDSRVTQGKLVVLEFQASWCPHCKRERSAWSALANTYADDDRLVFVSISVDQDAARWRTDVRGWKVASDHHYALRAEGGFDADVYRDFGATGVPHYLMVDGQGRFVDVRAPRPSAGLAEAVEANLLR